MDVHSSIDPTLQEAKKVLKGLTDEMQTCIQICIQCHQLCGQMIYHCLGRGGKHAEPAHIRILQDCAEICEVSANFMLRTSNFYPSVCEVCAKTCLACAQDCERIADDDRMELCVDLCRRCAESCTTMATHH